MEIHDEDKLLSKIRSLREQLKHTHDDFEKQESEFSEIVSTLITMLRAIPVGIGIVNNRTFGWVNDRLSSITGYHPSEISGRDSRFLYESEDEYQRVGNTVQRMLNLDRFASSETRWKKKNGDILDIALRCAQLNLSNREDGTVFAAFDITEIKRAERILKIQRDLGNFLTVTSNLSEALNQILDAALKASGLDCGGIYIVDEFDRSIRMISYTGVTEEFISLVGYYTEDTPQFQLIQAGKPVYMDYRNFLQSIDVSPEIEDIKAIAIIPVHYDGNIVGSLNIASHVTDEVPEWSRDALEAIASRIGGPIERIRLSEELEKSEERYRSIFHNATDGILVAEAETRIIRYANNSIGRMLGYEIEELIGKTIDMIHPPERLDLIHKNFRLLGLNKTNLAPNIPCIRKDKTLFYADIKAMSIALDGVKCITGFFTDITEKLLVEQEKDERVKRFGRQHVALADFLTDPELPSLSLKSSIRRTNEIAGVAMDVERTGVWLLTDDEDKLSCYDLFNKKTGEHSDDLIFLSADYPHYFEFIAESIALNADDARNDPKTNEFNETYFIPNNIYSVLDSAIRVHGKLKGVVSFEHTENHRVWKEDEISFAGEVADQIAKILLDQERKKTSSALQISEEKYRTLVNITGTGYIILDEVGRVVDANQEYLRMTGRKSIEEIIGKTVTDWTAHYDVEKSKKVIAVCMDQGFVNNFEVDYITPDDEIIPIEINAACIKTVEGIRILTLCRDITSRRKARKELEEYRDRLEELVEDRTYELKRAQEKLLTSERLAAIGRFAGSIAHEIRNPLNTISNAAHLLSKKIGSDESGISVEVSRIKRRAEDISKIIGSVMNIARMEEPIKNYVDITNFLREVISEIVFPKNIILETNITDGIYSHIDGQQITICIKNLVSNSIQAMPNGGTIKIEASYESFVDSKGIYIIVSDTGTGIAKENIDKIFEPLFTTKTYGIGFGLSIVKMIIEKHGGTITVESDSHGARFKIFLPEVTE